MFKQWVGEDYKTQSRYPRTLILGESHYGSGKSDCEKTIRCIEDQIKNNCPYRFFTKLVTAIIGSRPNLESKRRFWHSVVYHNLIIEELPSPRCAPAPSLWRASLLTLENVIREHRPQLCIAIGYRMWRELRPNLSFGPVSGFPDWPHCGVVHNNSLACYFIGMKHPSGRGFSAPQWAKWIDDFVRTKWPTQTFLENPSVSFGFERTAIDPQSTPHLVQEKMPSMPISLSVPGP